MGENGLSDNRKNGLGLCPRRPQVLHRDRGPFADDM